MPTMDTERRIFVVQRSAAYGYWPESTYVESAPIKLTDYPATIRVGFRGYRNRQTYSDEAKTLDSDLKFVFLEFGNGRKTGFSEGRTSYAENKEGAVVATVEYKPPTEGQIDLYLKVEADGEADIPVIHERLKPYLSSMLFLFSSRTSDILVPTSAAETHYTVEKHTTAHGEDKGINLTLKVRPQVSVQQVRRMVAEFSTFIQNTDQETVRRIDVAGRRILNGKNETDEIDKFSDFWEACEILCPKSKILRGKIDHRVSLKLAECIGRTPHELRIKLVGPLYDIRKDLVHSAVETPHKLKAMLPLVEAIAHQLLSRSIGLSSSSPVLSTFLQRAN